MKLLWKKRETENTQSEEAVDEIRGGNKQIMVVTYVFVGLFVGLIAYFVYFMVVDSKDVINNSYNQRQTLLAQRVVRGKILAADGTVLAETVRGADGKETRDYPYGNIFAHAVGHSTEGKTGIELMENFNLLTSSENPLTNISRRLADEKTIGDNAVTTLHVDLQKAAHEALGSRKGAVIVSEPSTGKILAMVSKPDYDPNPSSLNPQWDSLTSKDSEESCLVNRATQGLYPPGSTFKIVTALEYIRENPDYKKFSYTCKGSETQEGFTVNCYKNHVHGTLNLKNAFAKSCNSCFANLGTVLNLGKYQKTCEELLFQKELPTTFVYNKSSFVVNRKSNKEEVMHTAMGQGKTQITPLHMHMIASAVANKGKMMKTYVVDHLENSSGVNVRQYKPKEGATVMTEEEADILTEFMKEVVNSGTATSLSGFSYTVAGKTGSAEFHESKRSHSWFTGFAPANDPKVCVTVIVEESGTGSEYAVPIAKKMLQTYLGN